MANTRPSCAWMGATSSSTGVAPMENRRNRSPPRSRAITRRSCKELQGGGQGHRGYAAGAERAPRRNVPPPEALACVGLARPVSRPPAGWYDRTPAHLGLQRERQRTRRVLVRRRAWSTSTVKPLDVPNDSDVELWHPLGRPIEDVIAWRRWLEATRDPSAVQAGPPRGLPAHRRRAANRRLLEPFRGAHPAAAPVQRPLRGAWMEEQAAA